LDGYGDKGERKVWFSCGSTYCTWFAWRITRTLRMSVLVYNRLKRVKRCDCTCKVLGTLKTTTTLVRVFM